jgi:glycosyltransferase involved in cell wall biosynthesis
VVVTGHGIDIELFKPDTTKKNLDGKLKILSVGRIAPVKNYEILVDACKLLKDWNINFQVTMIGEPALEEDKTYEESLKSKIKSLGLESYFKFLGKVSHNDLPRHYQSHDLFIHLSKTGSLDKTMLEAILCGMRVLSSNDAARDFVSTGLFLFKNDPIDLADKIVIIATQQADPGLRNYVIENHNLDKLIDKISNYIKL